MSAMKSTGAKAVPASRSHKKVKIKNAKGDVDKDGIKLKQGSDYIFWESDVTKDLWVKFKYWPFSGTKHDIHVPPKGNGATRACFVKDQLEEGVLSMKVEYWIVADRNAPLPDDATVEIVR